MNIAYKGRTISVRHYTDDVFGVYITDPAGNVLTRTTGKDIEKLKERAKGWIDAEVSK